jgi:hypothetical protein
MVAPVNASTLTVSTPMPAEAPVTKIIFPVSFPSISSSLSISIAVGRTSSGPLGSWWAIAYLFVDAIVVKLL